MQTKNILDTPWKELSLVAFDTETSGAFPIGSEVVEVGLVRYEAGREVATFDKLIKPRRPMGEEVIKIHGITNEMVTDALPMSDVIKDIAQFVGDSILIAHHAPFDLGFLVYDLERFGLAIPSAPPLCSSLISRKVIRGTENHKLQTLVKHLNIESGPAHRAESDARACLQVALHCFEQIGPTATLRDLLKVQAKDLSWRKYSINELRADSSLRGVVEALEKDQCVEFVYMSGSMKGKTRKAIPQGIVRNPDGDYMAATCLVDNQKKRFYLNSIRDSLACFCP